MRTKVTLVLLLLNVVLFYYISHFEFGKIEKLPGKSVYGSEVASIDSFSRNDGSGIPVMLEKQKRGDWLLTKPYKWPANPNAISSIISELQHLNHLTSFTVDSMAKNGLPLSNYGMDNPAMTFTFVSGGKSYETKVGNASNMSNLYLLSPDGKQIHVVGSGLLDQLNRPLENLRSPSIFTIPLFETSALSIQTTTKVRLRRDGERWNLEAPIQTRANKNAVNTTINALNSLQTVKFLEPRDAADLTLTGLDKPSLQVTLEGNAHRETLWLGRPVPTTDQAPRNDSDPAARPTVYYAKLVDNPAVFTTAIPNALLDSLLGAQGKLRDAHVLDFDPRFVTGITLAAPGQPGLNLNRIEAAAGPEGWQLISRKSNGQAPQTTAADVTLVTELLRKLELFSSQKFISDAPSSADRENYGFNRPEREITLNLSSGGGPLGNEASTLTLQIGVKPEERGVAYAMMSTAPYVYQVDPAILDYTSVDPRQFRQRLLRELPESARITALNLTETGNAKPLYFHQLAEGESWEKALSAESDTRKKALIAVLVQLRSIRAQRFITESFNADHAESAGVSLPWKYQLEATLAPNAGNGAAQTSAITLQLTDRLDSTTLIAGSAEFGVTFAVTQEMVDALFTLTYGEKHDPGTPGKSDTPPAPGT